MQNLCAFELRTGTHLLLQVRRPVGTHQLPDFLQVLRPVVLVLVALVDRRALQPVVLVPAVGGAAVVRVSTQVRIWKWFRHVLRAAELSVRLKAGLELDHALRNAAFR